MKRPRGTADDDLHLVKRLKRDETQYMFTPTYIDDAIIEKMGECLGENAADKIVINLDNAYDTEFDDEILCISRSLQLFQGVESLSVKCSILSDTKSKAIAELINCSGITKLSIKYNSGAFGTLLESISPVKILSSLKLKSPQSSVADMLSLCMFLRKDNLLALDITGLTLTQETMCLLSNTLSYSKKLCSFQYSSAGLSYENLKTIGYTISVNSSIILSSATIDDGSSQVVSRRRVLMKKISI